MPKCRRYIASACRRWLALSLKPSDVIKVEGFLARDGSRLVNAVSVSTAEGKKLFAGSSFEGAPKQ